VAVQDYSDRRDGCFGRRGPWKCDACSYREHPGNITRTSRWFEANYRALGGRKSAWCGTLAEFRALDLDTFAGGEAVRS
jgi:hypothetical protein